MSFARPRLVASVLTTSLVGAALLLAPSSQQPATRPAAEALTADPWLRQQWNLQDCDATCYYSIIPNTSASQTHARGEIGTYKNISQPPKVEKVFIQVNNVLTVTDEQTTVPYLLLAGWRNER